MKTTSKLGFNKSWLHIAALAAALALGLTHAGAQVGSEDSDNDGLNDWEEVNVYGTNPNLWDTDGDSLNDGQEVLDFQTNPLTADTDGDGIGDWWEVAVWGTDPLNWDTDSDGLPDGWEQNNGLNPNSYGDQDADPDYDYVSNICEYYAGTLPNHNDDGDQSVEISWIGSPHTDNLDVWFSWNPPSQYDTFEIRRQLNGQGCWETRSASISGNTVTLYNELTTTEAYYGNPYIYQARFINGSVTARWKQCSD